MVHWRDVKRRQDTAIYRNQVWRKLNRDFCARRERKFLFNFREMPMFGHAVRPDAFVAFDEEEIRFVFAAGAADSAERIGDDAGRLDQARLEQWNYGQ